MEAIDLRSKQRKEKDAISEEQAIEIRGLNLDTSLVIELENKKNLHGEAQDLIQAPKWIDVSLPTNITKITKRLPVNASLIRTRFVIGFLEQ